MPIGLFDSGFGGLTVMQEVAKALPYEDLIYLGDTVNLPYGNKSKEALIRISLENGQFLLDKGVNLLIVACHTASAHAIDALQEKFPIPILGMTSAGQTLLSPFQRAAVLATRATISANVYSALYQQACPLFVPMIEEGFMDHLAMRLIAESYLAPLRGNIEAALLACTHYPLIRPLLKQVLGDEVQLLEPAPLVAKEAQLLVGSKLPRTPSYTFYTTDDPQKFHALAPLFWPLPNMLIEKKGVHMKP